MGTEQPPSWHVTVCVHRPITGAQADGLFDAVADAAHSWEPAGVDVDVSGGPCYCRQSPAVVARVVDAARRVLEYRQDGGTTQLTLAALATAVAALDADSVDEPDEPDIPTRLGQVSEGLCRQPNPDGQLCAYERPCPHHAGVPAAVDTQSTPTLQAELHRAADAATQPAVSLAVESSPEPPAGPGWDREMIDWLATWLDDNGRPFGGNQLRALLADRDRIGREAMAAYSRARFAEAGRNALARRWDDLTEERDAARADRDAVRAEVQRMAGDVEDLRATVAMRDRQLREARDSLAAALERGVATPEQWQAEQSWPSWPTAGGPAPAARLVWAPQRPAERDAARAELADAHVEIARLTDGWRTTDHLRDEWRQRADDATADLQAALVTIGALRDELATARAETLEEA